MLRITEHGKKKVTSKDQKVKKEKLDQKVTKVFKVNVVKMELKVYQDKKDETEKIS